MNHPIWYDFNKYSSGYIGYWKGEVNGYELTVPCVYLNTDVKENSPAQLARLKASIKKNGLSTWYHLAEEIYMGTYNDYFDEV